MLLLLNCYIQYLEILTADFTEFAVEELNEIQVRNMAFFETIQAISDAERAGTVPLSRPTQSAEKSAEVPKLSREVEQLLAGDELRLLREELAKQNILTLEQFRQINLWGFMNRYALYSVSQRQEIYQRILEMRKGGGKAVPEQQSVLKIGIDACTGTISEAKKPKADVGNPLISEAEKCVLATQLDGIIIDALQVALHCTTTAVKDAVTNSTHIVSLNGKLFHDEAFVDWEDGAEQLGGILDKLLKLNDGYISAAQLYAYVHTDMQMFLNDNDIDDPVMVYDLARHLFGKLDLHHKGLVFQGNHISRETVAVRSNLDVMRNFAREQGGIFREEDLVQYLRRVEIKTGNLRGQMHIYDKPIFFFYDVETYITAESMGIDETWLCQTRQALDRLFADMGDHVVLRDIQPWWYTQLPPLPGGRDWTALLLQSVLTHYSKSLGGARTISGLPSQVATTLRAMLVSGESEIQTFADAVIAVLIDDDIGQRRFEAEELRQLLVRRGMIARNELISNMSKALAKDERFLWDADRKVVTVRA